MHVRAGHLSTNGAATAVAALLTLLIVALLLLAAPAAQQRGVIAPGPDLLRVDVISAATTEGA